MRPSTMPCIGLTNTKELEADVILDKLAKGRMGGYPHSVAIIVLEDLANPKERLYVTSGPNDHDDNVELGARDSAMRGRGNGGSLRLDFILILSIRHTLFVLPFTSMPVWYIEMMFHALTQCLGDISAVRCLIDRDVESPIFF